MMYEYIINLRLYLQVEVLLKMSQVKWRVYGYEV